jgi:hypothetical protein
VAAEAVDPGTWNPRDRTKVVWEAQQLKLFDQVTAGDRFCATQH